MVGLLGLAMGVLPVIMANRSIIFDRYSHYALPSSLPAVIMIIGILFSVSGQKLRTILLLGMTFMSVVTHYAIGAKALHEENIVREIWWEMSWRATGLKPGTTLVVSYADIYAGEDQDMTWGPANLIYMPARQTSLPLVYPITAPPQNPDRMAAASAGDEVTLTVRADSMVYDYQKLLVIDRPGIASCAHVQDARWPRISGSTNYEFSFMANKSQISQVETGGSPVTLPAYLFGDEPERGWCYWYQQAEVAAQQNDWEKIWAEIDPEIQRLEMRPNDRVEWMPFLQAAAMMGDTERMRRIGVMIIDERNLKHQGCETLTAMAAHGFTLPPESAAVRDEVFCR